MRIHCTHLRLALFSASMLSVEIGLTRLVSTLYYPPAAFAILSLAVLGIGLGAALAALRADLRQMHLIPLYTAVGALLVVLALLSATLLSALFYPLFFFIIPLPFTCGGLALAALFGQRPDQSTRLYMADLVGAGAGALLTVPMFNWLGGINGLLCAALLLAVSFMGQVNGRTPGAADKQTRFTRASWGIGLFCALLLVSNLSTEWLRIDMQELPAPKPITEKLTGAAQLVQTRWDAFARTDLIDPGRGLPYEMYMDGAAGSVMPPAAGHEALLRDIGFFPFATEQPQRVFIIGPGGGLDVWFALQSGAQEIVAVEVNQASVALVREFAAYNGDLYGQPSVRVLVDEGRSVLGRTAHAYDLIFLSQVVTLAAERGGYALTENNTYTVEAFADYLAHLSPNGQVGLKLYDEPTLTRALVTVVEAFRRRNVAEADALRHVIVLLDPRAEPPIPLLLVRNAPYSRDDALSIGAVADQVGFHPLYLPGVWVEPPLDGILNGPDALIDLVARAENNLAPTTDNWPFFFQFEKGIPSALRPLLWGMALLLMAGAFCLWLIQRRSIRQIFKPQDEKGSEGENGGQFYGFSLYFAALGVGFMLVEVGLIQQTRLFLGHPTLAITLVLATLLIGGGVGSVLAGGVQRARATLPLWPLALILVWLAAWLMAWPGLSQTFYTAARGWRMGVAVLAIVPLALCLGMPFALGLQQVGRWGARQSALAWAVNGVMSVAGSLLAIVLAMLLGYRAVLGAAWLFYLLALLVVWRLRKSAYTHVGSQV